MSQLKHIIAYFLCFYLSAGCIDEIDLEGSGDGSGKMVIQGQLIKSCPSYALVQVSQSLDYRSRELPPPVTGAVVYLRNDQGQELLVPETGKGFYRVEIPENFDQFSLQAGQRYMIEVSTSESGQYLSGMETLMEVPEPDSVSIALEEREELDNNGVRLSKKYVQFFVHTPLSRGNQQDRPSLRWSFETIYQVTEIFIPGPGPGPQTCYVSRDLGLEQVLVFNGDATISNRLDQFMLVEDEAGARFGLGYLFKAKQQSLSREAYQYWNQVNQAVSLSGGLFEATPGKIIGNIYNAQDASEEVFGYFYAAEEVEVTRFVKPSEVGVPEDFCGMTQNASEDVCTNCTLIPFSTKEIPEGWEF